MANRHLSRSIVLQTLFEWDFNGNHTDQIPDMLARNIQEFGQGIDDTVFINTVLDGVIKKQVILDDIIIKAAPEWPIEKIAVADRNILRIGLFELLFGSRNEVPPKVAINEAIELAKSFGGDSSGRFVNGVLGAVYKEIGEPGKEQLSKKKFIKQTPEPIDITKLPIEQKAGAVVYARFDGGFAFAMVHDVFGYWTLSKGSVEEGENEEEGAIREIKEEIGLDMKIKTLLGRTEYIASHPEKGKIRKQVAFFLGESPYQSLTLETTGGLDGADWFTPEEILKLRIYDDIVPLLTKSIEYITNEAKEA